MKLLSFALPLIALAAIAGCSSSPSPTPSAGETGKASPAAAESPATAPENREYTLTDFQRVKTGMSLGEVEKILGKGELVSTSAVMDVQSDVYNWMSGFKGITVVLVDGKVSSVSQFGLK